MSIRHSDFWIFFTSFYHQPYPSTATHHHDYTPWILSSPITVLIPKLLIQVCHSLTTISHLQIMQSFDPSSLSQPITSLFFSSNMNYIRITLLFISQTSLYLWLFLLPSVTFQSCMKSTYSLFPAC